MRFERSPGDSVETQYGSYLERNERVVGQAYEKALTLIAREAVDPRGFDDIYSRDEIENDLKRVAERTATFENKDRVSLLDKAAIAAEALMYEQVGKSDWLSGEGVKVYPEKTAPVDDIFNKTDIVLTFEMDGEEEPLAVTVDVTIGMRSLGEKIHSIKQEIDTQVLTTVKYHETPSGDHVLLKGTPRVIMGMEPKQLLSLLTPWVCGEPTDREYLKKHPAQLALVQQVEAQLEAYEAYARATKKEAVANRFAKALKIARTIRNEKEKVIGSHEEARAVRDTRLALKSQLFIQKEPQKDEKKNDALRDILKRLRT